MPSIRIFTHSSQGIRGYRKSSLSYRHHVAHGLCNRLCAMCHPFWQLCNCFAEGCRRMPIFRACVRGTNEGTACTCLPVFGGLPCMFLAEELRHRRASRSRRLSLAQTADACLPQGTILLPFLIRYGRPDGFLRNARCRSAGTRRNQKFADK